MSSSRRYNSGFSYVRLSIVLVVIGSVIAGGIALGERTILNARVTKALNDILFYQTQFHVYQQNFGVLPGDDPAARARFPLGQPQLADGDGDGIIGSASLSDSFAEPGPENLQVWTQLHAAGLINATEIASDQPRNPFGGVWVVQNGAFKGSVSFTTAVLCLDNVPGAAADAIDAALDDGNPGTGSVMGSSVSVIGPVATDYSASGPYVVCKRL